MDPQQSAQTPTAGTPIYQESSQDRNAKWLWLLIVLIIVASLIFAFVSGFGPFGRFKGTKATESPTPVSSPLVLTSPSPEATASPMLDKAEAKIRVLNGSGKAGVASVVKDFLEGKGYRVVAIGNAASYDFEQTVLKFKGGFERFKEVLLGDLSDDYSVEVSQESLEATDSADIEVTVGAK